MIKTVSQQYIDEFIMRNTEGDTNLPTDVLRFIANFRYMQGPENEEVIRRQFAAGYCYYFASMLKTAFNRGSLVFLYYLGHIGWEDTDGCVYDINGFNKTYEDIVPISELGAGITDFKHLPTASPRLTDRKISQHLAYCVKNKEHLDMEAVLNPTEEEAHDYLYHRNKIDLYSMNFKEYINYLTNRVSVDHDGEINDIVLYKYIQTKSDKYKSFVQSFKEIDELFPDTQTYGITVNQAKMYGISLNDSEACYKLSQKLKEKYNAT